MGGQHEPRNMVTISSCLLHDGLGPADHQTSRKEDTGAIGD